MNLEALEFIHRFLPPKTETGEVSAYTLLLLHGSGGSEDDLLALGRIIAPGAALLSPRGKVLEGEMARYFRRFAEGVLDIEDLHYRTDELAAFIEAAAQHYHFDPRRVIAAGFSNGANIAANMLLSRPKVLAGAILLHPMVPFIPETLPDLTNVPVFIGAGRTDPITPPQEAEHLNELLQAAHAQVTMCWQAGGHTISLDEVRGMMRWMREREREQRV
jgi:phospholipase/carboxylesterase